MEESGGARALRRFLLRKCGESFRLAMSAYWLLAAAAEAEGAGGLLSDPNTPPAGSGDGAGDVAGGVSEGRAKVAQRLARAVLSASAEGRARRMAAAVASDPTTMFPEQAAFGIDFALQMMNFAFQMMNLYSK